MDNKWVNGKSVPNLFMTQSKIDPTRPIVTPTHNQP